MNPNLALAHRWYATYLRLMGRHEQAITEITRARELDPLSPGVNATVGYVLSSARRYDQAIEVLNRTVELDPNYPYTHSSSATPIPHRASTRRPLLPTHGRVALGLDTPATQIYLGAASAHAGDRARALAVLQQLQSSKQHVSGARAGDPADRTGRAGTGVRIARGSVSSTRYSAAVPWEWSRGSIRYARTRALRI